MACGGVVPGGTERASLEKGLGVPGIASESERVWVPVRPQEKPLRVAFTEPCLWAGERTEASREWPSPWLGVLRGTVTSWPLGITAGHGTLGILSAAAGSAARQSKSGVGLWTQTCRLG